MEVIVEFKAGLMRLSEGRLQADPRKGLIRVCQDEAGLTHFCWSERDASGSPVAGEPEKDIVVFPGECSFGKIPRPGSRVFELKFPEEKHRNLFFWSQDPDSSADDDYVAAIGLALSLEAGGEDAMDTEPAAAAPAPAAAAVPPRPVAQAGIGGGTSGIINAADLAAMLGAAMAGAGAGAGAGGMLARQRAAVDPGPSLGDVLKPEALAPLLREPGMVERLAPYLPEEHRSASAIAELVSTPQFRHQLDLLSHALMTGQLDTRQFGLPPGGFGVLDFLRGIQDQADQEKTAAAPAAGEAAQQGQQQQSGGGTDGGGGGAAQ